MKTERTVRIAIGNLAHHAFRSSLTALGVVFGVGAVVAMMAISEGARRESIRQIESQGIDYIIVHSVRPMSGAAAEDDTSWTAAEFGITADDIRHIGTAFENVAKVMPMRDVRSPIYANSKRTDIRVFGVLPMFLQITRSQLADRRGRFLTDRDGEESLPVCVLGVKAARTLFGFEDPLDKMVTAGQGMFRVVGLVRNTHGVRIAGGPSIDNLVLIHNDVADAVYSKTATERRAGSAERTKVEADYLYIKIREVAQVNNTVARLRTYLDKTHREKDYELHVPYELLKQREATQRVFGIVMASIAAISLLVGGIGIMNIMMANVYERTREIGIRRALGARQKDVLRMFLIESVVLTLIGGLVGLGVGWGLAEIVESYAEWSTNVTLVSVLLSLAVSILVGVAFGSYPAWKAAKLDPIQALRAE